MIGALTRNSPKNDAKQVDRRADRDEEQPQQQAPKGLDIDLDLVAVFGAGEQQARQERAERHRQAGRLGRHSRADNDQQHQGEEHFPARGSADEAEQRANDEAAGDQNGGDGDERLGQRPAERKRDRLPALGRQGADHEQDGQDRDVLAQQNGEAGLARRRAKTAFFDEKPHDNRGRGQREGGAEGDGGGQLVVEQGGDGGDCRAGHQHLCPAEPEHQAAHRPQPLERELEADHEQEEHHPQLGQGAHAFQIGNEGVAEPRRGIGQAAETIGADR